MELPALEVLNWEIQMFLSSLTEFRNKVNAKSTVTLELLNNARELINDFIEGSATVNTDTSAWPPFDEKVLRVQKQFVCRVCKMDFPVDYRAYVNHVSSEQHKLHLEGDMAEVDSSSDSATNKDSSIDSDDSRNNSESDDDCTILESKPFVIELSDSDSEQSDRVIIDEEMTVDSEGEASNEKLVQPLRDDVRLKPVNQIELPVACEPSKEDTNPGVFDEDESPIDANKSKPNSRASSTEKISGKFGLLRKFYGGDLSAAMFHGNKMLNVSERDKVISVVKTLLAQKFNTVDCHVIGSWANGTAIDNDAPLDIYLDLNRSFAVDISRKIHKQRMDSVEELLIKSREWSHIDRVDIPRFVILAARHDATQINCRFLFGSGVYTGNNAIVKSLLDAQNTCRQLVICIRMSLHYIHSNWTTKFSGYILSLLAIFYFQTTKRLPSVLSLQTEVDKKTNKNQCGACYIAFKPPTAAVDCTERLSILLIAFFEFYSKFDFNEFIVSVFEGCPINHNIRTGDETKLSNSIIGFKHKLVHDPAPWVSPVMCIQNIFNRDQNVTQMINGTDVIKFKEYCAESLKVLRESGDSLRF